VRTLLPGNLFLSVSFYSLLYSPVSGNLFFRQMSKSVGVIRTLPSPGLFPEHNPPHPHTSFMRSGIPPARPYLLFNFAKSRPLLTYRLPRGAVFSRLFFSAQFLKDNKILGQPLFPRLFLPFPPPSCFC